MKKWIIIISLLICSNFMVSDVKAVATELDLTEAQSKIIGTENARIGNTSIAFDGDVNGDGYSDILISYDDNSSSTDTAYLIYGSDTPVDIDTASASNISFTGASGEGYAGLSVAFGGDVNGDGYDDMIFGGSFEDSSAGVIYLVYGSVTEFSGENSLSSQAQFTGETAGDYAGDSIAGLGDVDNDGYDDFLIGARRDDEIAGDAGAAYLIYGQATDYTGVNSLAGKPKFVGEALNDYAGDTVSTAGDYNNDGYDDFLIVAGGKNFYTGQVYLINGQAGKYSGLKNLSSADVTFVGEETYDGIGSSLTTIGDINDDGYDDILIGSNEESTEDVISHGVYLIYGASSLNTSINLANADAKFIASDAGDSVRYNVRPIGDYDQNGYDDFVIGVPTYLSNSGAVYVFNGSATNYSGNNDLADSNYVILGEDENDQAGSGLTSSGDYNNDGFSDLVFGASGEDTGGSGSGAVYLVMPYIDLDGDGLAGDSGLLTGDDTNDNDYDNDGSETGTDCNDEDATVYENQTYYKDDDEDGLGDSSDTTSVCSATAPAGYVTNANDTNDNIANNDVEINGDGIDNDGDGEIDENNTTDNLHPEFNDYDPNDSSLHSTAVSSVVGYKEGKILVTFVDDSVYEYTIFNNNTTTKTTKVKQYRSKGYYLVLQGLGKRVALVNIYNGNVLKQKVLSSKNKYQNNNLKLFKLRNKYWSVVTSKNKKNKVRLVVTRVLINKEKFGTKSSVTFKNKKIKVTKTKHKNNYIKLNNSSNKLVKKYLLTKKYNLINK